jgi:membrane associated rhomboid family serine protease
MIEEKYGSLNLLIMFITTSIVIGIFNSILDNYMLCGASGNVYMLIVLSSFSNITEGKIPLTLVLILIFYISTEIKDGLLKKDNTYHFGHLLGAVCGLGFGFLFWYYPDTVNNILNALNI